jgi:hypothetical protein
MRKLRTLKAAVLIVAVLFPIGMMAQGYDSRSNSSKIDSIYTLQKRIYNEGKLTPLTGKNYGIEVNVFRLLYIDQAYTFSGGLSLFNVDRNSEVAFPFYIQSAKNDNELSEFTLDCHYRYFLGESQKGFYASLFTRYAFLNGTTYDPNPLLSTQTGGKKDTQHKFGFGVGFGYRVFSFRGLYWGSSMSVGRYLLGENNRFDDSGLFGYNDDGEFIFDIELLKFGWAF